jgi:hypothetical protein
MAKKILKTKQDSAVSPREMNVKLLLEAMAVINLITGLMLILVPTFLPKIVLEISVTDSASIAMSRVTGTAILSIGMICWMVRMEGRSKAGKGIVTGLAIYNALLMMVLAYTIIVQGFSTPGLWAFIFLYSVMAGWCIRTSINMKIVSKYQKLF